MAESESKSLEQTDSEQDGGGRSGVLGWLVGWLLVPALVVGALFAAGVHVGAQHPDMLLTRGVLWVTKGEVSRPPATPEEAAPLSRQLYLLALPTKEFGLQVELDAKDLARLAPGESPADLDCKLLCERVWNEQHPDKVFVSAHGCSVENEKSKLGALECELEVER